VQGQRRQSADIKGDVCSSTLNRLGLTLCGWANRLDDVSFEPVVLEGLDEALAAR